MGAGLGGPIKKERATNGPTAQPTSRRAFSRDVTHNWSVRGRDEGASAIVATIILVAVAVVAAAVLLVTTSSLQGNDGLAPTLTITANSAPCDSTVTVIATSGPIQLDNLKIQPLGGEGSYAITLANRATTDAPWEGAPGDGMLRAGTEFRVWATEPLRQFAVIDLPTNSIIARFAGPSNGADTGAPTAGITTPVSFTTLTGTTSDACSGTASVAVTIHDSTASIDLAGPLAASLATAGAKSSTWSLDVSSLGFVAGHSYLITAVPTDSAGNVGAPAAAGAIMPGSITNFTQDPPPGTFTSEVGAAGSTPTSTGDTQFVGDSLSSPAASATNPFVNGVSRSFSLSYNSATGLVQWTIGSTTIQYTTDASPASLSTLQLRLVSVGSGTVSLSGMSLDGTALYDASATGGGKFVSLIPTAALSDGFTLTGQATLSWSGAPPFGLKFELAAGS